MMPRWDADLGDVVERFDHVSLAVHDIRRALPLVALLGGEFREGGDNTPGRFRWVQFDLPGGSKLEMIEPFDPDDTAHFLVKFLQAHGEGVHHVTVKVTDLDRAISRAVDLGFEVVGVDTSDDNWKEAFIHPRSANGVLVQIAEWADTQPDGQRLEDVIGAEIP